jgi:hypothetical protein
LVLFLAAIALAAPVPASAQSQRDRERERERIQREQEWREREREREQERREREQQRWDREQERRERERAGSLDTTIAFDAHGTISVACPGGAVFVTGSEKSELRVRARTESGPIRFVNTGSRATLESTYGRGCRDGRFEVIVPVGARVTANSWSGSVRVHGVHGDVETHTQSGNIEIRDVGRLDLETLSGDVRVQGVKGDAMIHTVSGDIQLGDVHGDVEIETVSGDVDLGDIVAKQVRTHSTSGDLAFSGQLMDGGRYEFNTHSGNVRLQIPAGVGAQLSVSTFSGAIESDFPITLKAGEQQAKRLSFTVGQGSARVVVETFSGDITLSSTARRRR